MRIKKIEAGPFRDEMGRRLNYNTGENEREDYDLDIDNNDDEYDEHTPLKHGKGDNDD